LTEQLEAKIPDKGIEISEINKNYCTPSVKKNANN